jgi:soluble lytic murein transglycosylase-like protein
MAAENYQNQPFQIGQFAAPPRVAPLAAEGLAQTAQAAAKQGQAVGEIGGALVDFAAKVEDAQQKAQAIEINTKALVAFNGLEEKFKTDPDYATQPKRYEEESRKIVGSLLDGAGLDPAHRAFAENHLTQLSLSTGKTIQQRAFAGQQSQTVANLNQSDIGYQTRYLSASSDVERASVLKQQQDGWASAVAAGWINAEQGQRAVESFRRQAQDGELLRAIEANPRAAQEALADPARFSYLDPNMRAARQMQAQNALDTRGQLEIGNLALRAPEQAALAVGKASDRATVAAIYDKGVIPQESGGRADAVSSAGALGVGQLMPDTARAAAKRLGLNDVAALDDGALKTRLLSDASLNRRLGLNEFQTLVERYGGDIPAALAGYNAGPGNKDKPRADAWRSEAIAKFGPNYTPEQFASLIPIKETRDYVLKIYDRLGARADAYGLSENARLRAQTQVASAVAAENGQTRALYARMAADAVTNDPVADALKGGSYVDPGRISAQRQILTQAATAGDATAAKELRQLDYAEEAAPVMAQAYRMAPAQLSAIVNQEQARLANSDAAPADLRRLETLKTVLSDVQSRAASDPVGLAARAGAFRADPLPVDAPTSPQFSQALAARDAQAAAAAKMYGGNLAPLRPQEAAALKNFWEQSGPSDRIGLAAQFAAHLSPDAARAAMRQVAGDDSLSRTAGQIALRAPETAQKIMQGATLLESGTVKPKVSDVRAALGDVMKGQIYGSARMQNEATEAALAVYAANRAASDALFDATDRPGLEAAIQEVTGKVVSINGGRAPIPPGIAPAAVTRAMADLTVADLAPFGGLQKGLDPAHVAAHAQLHALEIGGSAYALTIGGRPVMDASGTRPLVVDMAALAKSKAAPRAYDSVNAAAADVILKNPVAFK